LKSRRRAKKSACGFLATLADIECRYCATLFCLKPLIT
jgi:hypothetical protein